MLLSGDRTSFIVPLPVRKSAKLGLELRRKSKRGNDIRHSFEVATALITGTINKDILLKMAVFFKEQTQNKTATNQQLLLWGGEAGLKFVLEHVKELQKK
jgi:hypothetical protein